MTFVPYINKKCGYFDLHPKSWTQQPTIEVQILLWVKYYAIKFKLQVFQPILNRKMSIREAARF